MTQTPTSNDLTRQQLEELDALLQRMLSAPPAVLEPRRDEPRRVEPPAVPAVPPVVESWRVDRPAPLPPRLHVVVPERPAPPVAMQPPPFVPAEPPIPPTAPVPSLVELELQDRVPVTPLLPFQPPVTAEPSAAERAPDAEFPVERFDPIPLQSAMLSLDPEPTTTIEFPPEDPASADRIPLAMWPVFAVNWIAEECLKSFGGESLTRPVAKWAMGIAGLAMIAGAAIWTLQGYGIVSFFGK